MDPKRIRKAASYFHLLMAGILIWCWWSSQRLMPGALYLVVAGYPSVISLYLAAILERKQDKGPAYQRSARKAYVLLLSALQVGVIGVLNILPDQSPIQMAVLIIGYFVVGVFIILSYLSVSLSDRADQAGGAMPVNYFGSVRSRRVFFVAFIYAVIGILVTVSLTLSSWADCPAPLRPPAFWLFVVALSSVATAALLFHRYRDLESKHGEDRIIGLVTVLVLGFAGIMQFFSHSAAYGYTFSSIAFTSIAASLHWLLRAREASEAVSVSPSYGFEIR